MNVPKSLAITEKLIHQQNLSKFRDFATNVKEKFTNKMLPELLVSANYSNFNVLP
jgi:hypothetical protein